LQDLSLLINVILRSSHWSYCVFATFGCSRAS